MTNEELKAALVSGCPVESGGIVYKCVSAIITDTATGNLTFPPRLRTIAGTVFQS